MLLYVVIVLAGNLPWLLPVLQYIVRRSKVQKSFNYINETAAMLIKERRKEKESRKVCWQLFPYSISLPL